MTKRNRTVLAVAVCVLVGGAGTTAVLVAAGDAPADEAVPVLQPNVAPRVAGASGQVRYALRPAGAGIDCLEVSGLSLQADGGTSTNCAASDQIATLGFTIGREEGDGSVTFFGLGPRGTVELRVKGSSVALDKNGFFVVHRVAAATATQIVFSDRNGKALKETTIPAVTVPSGVVEAPAASISP